MGRPILNLTGRKFGRLTVRNLSGVSKHGNAVWLCSCRCGNTLLVVSASLRNGNTRSCGCRQIELATTHGHNNGGRKTGTYIRWQAMRDRCSNPNNSKYSYYGGRGIRVCKRWKSFQAFLKDMGECPRSLTLERVDNDKGYTPSNCVWATRKEQIANRRKPVK